MSTDEAMAMIEQVATSVATSYADRVRLFQAVEHIRERCKLADTPLVPNAAQTAPVS